MDRQKWLDLKKREAVRRYDRIFAPDYDAHWGRIDPTHDKYILTLAAQLKAGETVLDAACGTGKYWPLLLESSLQLIGVDQSRGMLDNLRRKYPGAKIMCSSLQALALKEKVAAVICVDAMENVPPEDWPGVLENLGRVLLPDGLFYFTVEFEEQSRIDSEYTTALAAGLPVVPGESALEGYHYFPEREQVQDWLQPRFEIICQSEGDGYWHLLCRKALD